MREPTWGRVEGVKEGVLGSQVLFLRGGGPRGPDTVARSWGTGDWTLGVLQEPTHNAPRLTPSPGSTFPCACLRVPTESHGRVALYPLGCSPVLTESEGFRPHPSLPHAHMKRARTNTYTQTPTAYPPHTQTLTHIHTVSYSRKPQRPRSPASPRRWSSDHTRAHALAHPSHRAGPAHSALCAPLTGSTHARDLAIHVGPLPRAVPRHSSLSPRGSSPTSSNPTFPEAASEVKLGGGGEAVGVRVDSRSLCAH